MTRLFIIWLFIIWQNGKIIYHMTKWQDYLSYGAYHMTKWQDFIIWRISYAKMTRLSNIWRTSYAKMKRFYHMAHIICQNDKIIYSLLSNLLETILLKNKAPRLLDATYVLWSAIKLFSSKLYRMMSTAMLVCISNASNILKLMRENIMNMRWSITKLSHQ